jgi:hypothetical protein
MAEPDPNNINQPQAEPWEAKDPIDLRKNGIKDVNVTPVPGHIKIYPNTVKGFPISSPNLDLDVTANLDKHSDQESIAVITESVNGVKGSFVSTPGNVGENTGRYYVGDKFNFVSFNREVSPTDTSMYLSYPNYDLWDDVAGFTLFSVSRILSNGVTPENWQSDAGIFEFGFQFFGGGNTAFRLAYVDPLNPPPESTNTLSNFNTSNVQVDSFNTPRPEDGVWTLDVLTWKPTEGMQWYRNGTLLADMSAADTLPTGGPLTLGRNRPAFVTLDDNSFEIQMTRFTTWPYKFEPAQLDAKTTEYLDLYT